MGKLNATQRREQELKRAIQAECHRQVDEGLKLKDPETGEVLIDVIMAHVIFGYGINVGIQLRHPEEDGRAEEDTALREPRPKPTIEVVTG